MSKTVASSTKKPQAATPDQADRRSENLRDCSMMAHLVDALQQGRDIGHYGRLVFVMVARHFMADDEMVKLVAKQPGEDEVKARALVLQVQQRDYNPPKRERILEWQAQQEFPILPDPEDPACGNVYRDLKFPEHVYEEIDEFYEDQAEARAA